MNLKGLKINFLGDSITEGHGATPETRFTTLIEQEQGAICRNYGIGGTRIARQSVPSENPRWDLDFCTRVYEMEEDADVVVVFGGTNDFGHGDAPFGEFEDRTQDTYCGALHVLMRSLITRYPKAKIVFLTPLHRLNEDNPRGDGGKPQDVNPLKAYVDVLRRTAEYYSLPVLDLYAVSGMQPAVPVIQEMYMPDGLHPNCAGHRILADKIVAFLSAM
ncbi:MAG: SGNH/GDSL hydrolase family protein [Oscillospiraceae bacterium]|nr:SGNH/GDSL hydrolase family protein [Oscillospiraceae bacterium]